MTKHPMYLDKSQKQRAVVDKLTYNTYIYRLPLYRREVIGIKVQRCDIKYYFLGTSQNSPAGLAGICAIGTNINYNEGQYQVAAKQTNSRRYFQRRRASRKDPELVAPILEKNQSAFLEYTNQWYRSVNRNTALVFVLGLVLDQSRMPR